MTIGEAVGQYIYDGVAVYDCVTVVDGGKMSEIQKIDVYGGGNVGSF